MDQVITTKHKSIISDLPLLFRKAMVRLMQNDPLRMAGATAFFTSFALPFILLLITQFLSLLIDPMQLRRELFGDLVSIFGRESVRQVVDTLIAFRQLADNLFFTLVGFLFLLLVATTLLMIIKGSINQIWRIKVGHGRSFIKQLGTRLKSILIIVATGVLVIVSIVAEAAKVHMGRSISELSTSIALYFNNALTYVLSLVFVTIWFSIIFRLLPDARPNWKVAFTGAFVTAILFTIGKILLRFLLTYSNLNSLYGASASVVLIMLFVFYSSLIMYFGAAFTRVWADYVQQPIKLLPYSTYYKVMETKK